MEDKEKKIRDFYFRGACVLAVIAVVAMVLVRCHFQGV